MPSERSQADRTLEARDVSKYFGDHGALKRIQLRLAPSDSVLVYGPNGAGKTTLLRTLAGVSRPSEGEVRFGGQSLHRNPGNCKAEIGFVSHATLLYGDLTARENLRFAGKLFGLRDLEEKMDAVLELFALRDRARQPVRTLSRGLQQRVALARAFLHQPSFLLLDEPFTGLDAEAAKTLGALLKGMPGTGKAVVFSTHSFEEGAAVASRLIAMEDGWVRYDGPLSLAPLEALRIAKGTTQQGGTRV